MNHSRIFHRIHPQPLDWTILSLCPHCPLLPQKVSVIRVNEDRMPSIKDTKGQRQLLENTAVVSVTGIRIPLGEPHPMHPPDLSVRRYATTRHDAWTHPHASVCLPKETADICAIGESSLVDRVSGFARFYFHFFFKRRPDT